MILNGKILLTNLLKRSLCLPCCFMLSAVVSFTACSQPSSGKAEQETPALPPVDWENDAFDILTGVNLSHWFSQTSTRPVAMERYVTQSDIKKLAGYGFDHVRLPVDEKEIFSETGEWNEKALKLIHNTIGWCESQNMRVIFDLHILRSHYFNNTQDMTLWKDKAEQDKFVDMWKKISAEFKKYPNSLLAYELLNEPVPPGPDDWNMLMSRVIMELRELEPERTLVLDPSSHSSISALKTLAIPESDKHFMLSVHFYTPHLLTHYKANWMDGLKNLEIPIHYPGQLVEQADYDTISIQKHKDVVKYYNGYYDKSVLQQRLQEAIDISKKTGLQLHIGEVGCIETTPIEVKRNWYRDVVEIFKENNIAFSLWSYKNDFGLFSDYGIPNDKELIDIITK